MLTVVPMLQGGGLFSGRCIKACSSCHIAVLRHGRHMQAMELLGLQKCKQVSLHHQMWLLSFSAGMRTGVLTLPYRGAGHKTHANR